MTYGRLYRAIISRDKVVTATATCNNCPYQNADYFIEGQKLKECYKEKDLVVLISSDLKVGAQCNQGFLKADKMLGLIKQTTANKTPVMLSLY